MGRAGWWIIGGIIVLALYSYGNQQQPSKAVSPQAATIRPIVAPVPAWPQPAVLNPGQVANIPAPHPPAEPKPAAETPPKPPPPAAKLPKVEKEILTAAAIAALIVAASRRAYYATGHPCACPDDRMRNGHACGGRSAYSKPGGASPLCYLHDVSQTMIEEYRKKMASR